jgi:hypothetical protein
MEHPKLTLHELLRQKFSSGNAVEVSSVRITRAEYEAAMQGPPALPEPMFWVRLRSDGGYEGPIHNDAMEASRKQSGAWTPLCLDRPSKSVDAKDYLALVRTLGVEERSAADHQENVVTSIANAVAASAKAEERNVWAGRWTLEHQRCIDGDEAILVTEKKTSAGQYVYRSEDGTLFGFLAQLCDGLQAKDGDM